MYTRTISRTGQGPSSPLVRVTISLIVSLLILLQQTGLAGFQEQENGGKRSLELLDAGYPLPIRIMAIRNFRSEHWVRDLQIEIRNLSSKPIYEIYLNLLLPLDTYSSYRVPLSIPLEYGRLELIHPRRLPTAEDKALEPGESAVLTVDERCVRGYEHHIAVSGAPDEASYKVRLVILAINCGDGTGFINGGVPYPGTPAAPRRPVRYRPIDVVPDTGAVTLSTNR